MLFHAILLNENGNFRQNLWIAIGLDRVMQWEWTDEHRTRGEMRKFPVITIAFIF
jgi:hypothetical protein